MSYRGGIGSVSCLWSESGNCCGCWRAYLLDVVIFVVVIMFGGYGYVVAICVKEVFLVRVIFLRLILDIWCVLCVYPFGVVIWACYVGSEYAGQVFELEDHG